MAEIVSAQAPLCEIKDGRGYITTPWFRYLVASTPQGTGTGTGVLHGNGSGAPTWGPVVLTTDVSGKLPVANGGIGDVVGISGGVLTFTGPSTVISSTELAVNRLVAGGGPGAAPSTPIAIGAAGQVLKGTGALPVWDQVDLAADVTGVLPIANGGTGGLLDVAHGGTGVTTKTGTNNVVLSDNPSLASPNLSTPLIINGDVVSPLQWVGFFGSASQLRGADSKVASVTAAATTLVTPDESMFFIVHDQTSGGITVGVMDATGGVVTPVAFAGIVGIAFTRAAGTGLQAAVIAGANPRSLSTFAISLGAP